MKTINVTFEDKEFKELEKRKANLSWREFILKIIQMKGGNRQDENNKS